MIKNRAIYITHLDTRHVYGNNLQYEVKPKGWLRRSLWWWLIKLGSVRRFSEMHVKDVKTIVVNEEVISRIEEEVVLFWNKYHHAPNEIFIGTAACNELMNIAKYPIDTRINNGSREFRGMMVTVVPHYEGILLI